MAEKKIVEQREYVIPLRREWMKVSKYKRTRRSVQEIKKFVAKHMHVPDRDLKKVKLDVYLNNELWFRGCKKPPAKIKVLAKRDKDVVRVEMVNIPESVKFVKARQEKLHKKVEKKKVAPKTEEKDLEEKVEEEKKEEVEKEKSKSVEQAQEKAAEKMARAQKHTIKEKAGPVHRKALKK